MGQISGNDKAHFIKKKKIFFSVAYISAATDGPQGPRSVK